ncbi:cellulose biosynthesis protein BcsO [Atlantibacter sp.]|uniref:cellulose biosynthesis protein BcsO n=1 Tax=Atlantibacter sp. TaxID=1903473 RepID=UPI0028AC1866|nr:cellulose biosynthesis protein BcsO [Atlantibacter sp.]
MKNYDDLQRFKDKTRTGAIDFKDMSAQSQQHSSGNWAIIKQLESEGDEQTLLAQGGSVSAPVPQAVDAHTFEASLSKPAQTEPKPTTTASSIFGSLAPQQTDVRQTPAQPPLLSQVPPPSSAAAPVLSSPAAPVDAPASGQNQPVRFDQLFATKGTTPTGQNAKDIPLQTLLETIASCR